MRKRKKRLGAALLALCLTLALGLPATAAGLFSDLSGHWAESEVMALSRLGIVNGYPDGRFGPNDLVTEGALCKMVCEATQLMPGKAASPAAQGTSAAIFSDAAGTWAEQSVEALFGAGIILSWDYDDDGLKINAAATRAELAQMVIRAMKINMDAEVVSCSYTDQADVLAHKDGLYISAASRLGIMTGMPDGSFGPDKPLSRAEASAVLCRMLAAEGVKLDKTIPANTGADAAQGAAADGGRATGTYTSADGKYTAAVGEVSVTMNGADITGKTRYANNQADTPNPFSTYTPECQIDSTYSVRFYLYDAAEGETYYGPRESGDYTSKTPDCYLSHYSNVVVLDEFWFTVEHVPTLEDPLLTIRFHMTYSAQSYALWGVQDGEVDGFLAMDYWSALHKDDELNHKSDSSGSTDSSSSGSTGDSGSSTGRLVPVTCKECGGACYVRCVVCGGTGKKPGQSYSCISCGGAGKIMCRYCGGMGYKLEYQP